MSVSCNLTRQVVISAFSLITHQSSRVRVFIILIRTTTLPTPTSVSPNTLHSVIDRTSCRTRDVRAQRSTYERSRRSVLRVSAKLDFKREKSKNNALVVFVAPVGRRRTREDPRCIHRARECAVFRLDRVQSKYYDTVFNYNSSNRPDSSVLPREKTYYVNYTLA